MESSKCPRFHLILYRNKKHGTILHMCHSQSSLMIQAVYICNKVSLDQRHLQEQTANHLWVTHLEKLLIIEKSACSLLNGFHDVSKSQLLY